MIKDIYEIEEKCISSNLKDALFGAVQLAERMHSKYLTLEHVLYGITVQKEFGKFCKILQIDNRALSEEIYGYVDSLERNTEDDGDGFFVSVELKLLISNLMEIWSSQQKIPELAEAMTVELDVPDVVVNMSTLEGTFAQHIIDKYLGGDVVVWEAELMKAYGVMDGLLDDNVHDNVSIDELLADEEPADASNEETADASKDDVVERTIIGFPGSQIMARAFVNGKEIDLTGDEMYQRLVASAGRLMSSLKGLGINPVPPKSGKEQEAKSQKPKKQPWEGLVTCINDTYKTKKQLVGRKGELERTIRILCRREKNNPLFIGEPGVGKTAIIYGLARLIEEADKDADVSVPEWLHEQRIYALDMTTMVAGASFHGEFEKRMKAVLDGARQRGNCILYIDEIHTIMGAGGGNNTMNAADMLKPYLEDGSIRFIGSTTYQEYNKSIAGNKAIARRFGQIDVKEPSVGETIEIISGILPSYEEHHGVKYAKEAVRYAVEQSHALIHDRFLPDKAIDIIDEAGAMLQQKPLLDKNGNPKQKRYQKVSIDMMKRVLTEVCRIDAKVLSSESNEELRDLDKRIAKKIYGQDEAIRQVVRSVMMAKAGLGDPDKPLASLLFVGPTGVGKTEVCKVLAKELGVELLRFDMSEYTEKHTVSKLIGSPAGYVGYEEGGLLTDAIRRTPNCVLLLDEIEKAHLDIYNLLLQVMDYARLTDNKGNKVSFKNVLLVMTSNAGAQYAGQAQIGFGGGQSKGSAMMQTVKKTFKPEFLNRLSATVVFNDMDRHMASLILDRKLNELSSRLEKKNVAIHLSDDAHEYLLKEGFSQQYGAREMDRAINQHLTPLLMDAILFGKLKKGGEAKVECVDGVLKM